MSGLVEWLEGQCRCDPEMHCKYCDAAAEIAALRERLAEAELLAERRADQILSDRADFESRLEFLSSAVTRIAATGHTISEAVAALNREAALRADAERYRAIRYHACKPGWGGASFSGGTPEQCDMATDELVVKMNAALAPAKEQP